jgi:RNA polymerase sigma factor (sigma-70 family)
MEPEFEHAEPGFVSGQSLSGQALQNVEPDWGAVVRRHDNRLRSRVRRVLSRMSLRAFPELVEELMQEVYCRLLESGAERLRRCRGGTEPELISFMGIIAERVVLDHMRLASASKRRGRTTIRLGRLGRRSRRAVQRLADPRPNPEEDVLRRERRRLLLDECRRLRGLGPGRRNVWVMRMAVFEGYSSREISAAAGGHLTPRRIDNLVHRIRRRLARSGLEVPRR